MITGGIMRLRNVRGSQERILGNQFTIQTDGVDGDCYKGLWNTRQFRNTHPIHIEIGMGKGQFITQLAKENPDINYIGIEKYSSVLVRAMDKRDMLEMNNLIFLRMDAGHITQYFASGEVSKIYLNFSDPWPKDRHAKRRLTSSGFLEKYGKILCSNGTLQFKTDNRPLFDFSLKTLEEAGWDVGEVSFHLHQNGPAPDNIMTEYEEKFYQRGIPICRLVAQCPAQPAATP